MIIYSSDVGGFKKDIFEGRLIDALNQQITLSYKASGYNERLSWQNSLQFMNTVVTNSNLPNDAGVAIEYMIPLHPCAYLHNYISKPNDPLKAENFTNLLMESPLFDQHDGRKLCDFLNMFIRKGDNRKILYYIDNGRIRPSKSLQDNLLAMLRGNKAIVDEAHRLNAKSGFYGNQGENQVMEIIKASKCSVFFVDDYQIISLKDIGESEEIRKQAKRMGAIILEEKLESQFRCNGSDGYTR